MKKLGSKLILTLFGIYFLLPLLMTVVYVFSKEWTTTILPKGFTFEWMATILSEPRFLHALGNSLILASVTCVVILLIMIPSVTIIFFYFPKLDKFLQVFSLMPYAIPGVILATGLLKMYSGFNGIMFWVLVGALFVGSFPLMYQAVRNSLLSLNAKVLIEAAETLGASHIKIFTSILLPNIRLTLKLSGLLVFSSIFGEFALTNLLIGGRFETIRVYMLQRMNENGHLASAVMVVYFTVLILLAIILNNVGSWLNTAKSIRLKTLKPLNLKVTTRRKYDELLRD